MKPRCWICDKKINTSNANGIYTKGGLRYYCKDKECQERFIEDAGEAPEEL